MNNIKPASPDTFVLSRVGETPIILELEQTQEAMSRIGEIAILNPSSAPELLACFGKALAELNKALSVISLEIVKASHKRDRRKASIILDELPGILIAKNLKSSEDVRNAILSLDAEYSKYAEQKEMFEAVFENLKGKSKNLELSLYSIKTITQYKIMPRYNLDDMSNKEFSIGSGEERG